MVRSEDIRLAQTYKGDEIRPANPRLHGSPCDASRNTRFEWPEPLTYAQLHRPGLRRLPQLQTCLMGTAIVFSLFLAIWYFHGVVVPGLLGVLLVLVFFPAVCSFLFFVWGPWVATEVDGNDIPKVKIRPTSVCSSWGLNQESIKLHNVKSFEWKKKDDYLLLVLSRYDGGPPFEAAVPEELSDVGVPWREIITLSLLRNAIPLKTDCPQCGSVASATSAIWNQGQATCQKCAAVFPLSEIPPDFRFELLSNESRSRHGSGAPIVIDMSGNGDPVAVDIVGEELVFTARAAGISRFWIHLGASLSALWNAKWEWRGNLFSFYVLCFMIPWVASGLYLLRWIALRAWGRRALHMTRNVMVTELSFLGWSRTQRIPLDKVRCARPNLLLMSPSEDVEIYWDKGSFTLPTSGTMEQFRLIGQINDYLAGMPGRDYAGSPAERSYPAVLPKHNLARIFLLAIRVGIVLCMVAFAVISIATHIILQRAPTAATPTHTVPVGRSVVQYLTPSQYRWTFSSWAVVFLILLCLAMAHWIVRRMESKNSDDARDA